MRNHTKIFFQKHFKEEVLKSEKLRTKVLAGIFLFGLVYTGFIVFLFNNNIPAYLRNGASLRIFLFLCALFLFEVFSMLYINQSIKRNLQAVPVVGQYLNAFFEITAPSVIMLILPAQLNAPEKILHSPTVYLYFIFIILSTLRLNYKISLFMGVVAAIEFFIVSHVLISYAEGTARVSMINSEYFAAIGKSMLLVLSGIGASFVARQIKSGVDRSLAAAEQSNKIANLFGQQVSKEVVEEMMEKGGNVQTKLMRVCIMFIDIRNFTNYVANKTPAEIVDYQNAFFRIVVAAVMKHKGIINQFLGDGCMVTFGAPVPLENPSEYALKAALEIRYQLFREIDMGAIPFTNIGIGIHEGDAVTGNIGPVERQQYSITGSVVILAARIEQLNKEYNSQILISENVMRKIEPIISSTTEFLGKINLKGWNNSIGIYKVA
jgi:adenylate cyclase